MLEGFPELVGQPFVALLDGVLRTGIPYEGKGALARMPRGPGGSLADIYFNFVYSPLRGRDGAVEGVLVAGFEVTAEVGTRRELEEAQWLLRSVIDNVPELAWTARPDGHIDFYNQRWYEYTGTSPEQMDGWGWRSVHDPALLPSVLTNWAGSLASGKPFEMEFPLRAADGSSSEDRRRALLAGFTMHIAKPVDPAELIAVTTTLARMAKALRSTTS